MQMDLSARQIMNGIVPITRFNRGEAAKIFEEVAASGTKVVLKNNTPACVLMSPEEYMRLSELLEDYALALEAEERIAKGGSTTSMEDVMRECGITEEELEGADEVELE